MAGIEGDPRLGFAGEPRFGDGRGAPGFGYADVPPVGGFYVVPRPGRFGGPRFGYAGGPRFRRFYRFLRAGGFGGFRPGFPGPGRPGILAGGPRPDRFGPDGFGGGYGGGLGSGFGSGFGGNF